MDTDTRSNGDKLRESASKLLRDWLDLARAATEEAEKFVREKPVTGAAIAFVTGWILGAALKR